MTARQCPYVRLAIAILVQAVRDAGARCVTTNPDSTMPTAADVADARTFLAAPAMLRLAADLGLHPGYVRRLATVPHFGRGPAAGWLTVREAARRFGYHPERVRWLIRAGRVEAVRVRGGGWCVNPASVEAYRRRR
jgi:excisionase family DNA binding protein